MSRTAFWALALASISGCMAADSNSYRGAVVDYNFIRNYSAPRENLMANVRKFEGFIKQAKAQSADIIVFPEGALNAGDRTIFVNIPDPSHNVTPAGNNSWDEALGTLSSYANASKIYVVVNIHEGSTDPQTNRSLKYNTNVVFNRDGTVIARYRKYNLFGESYLNVTNEPELSTFQTDFGVTFGQFTCFDILFEKPALKLVKDKKIKNFVYPTWWFSELPFLTAAQAQWSWAVGNNVNLLAAGINNVPGGSSGSSIIPGRAPSWGDANFVFSNKTADTLIVANLPKDPSVVDGSFIGQPVKQITLYRDNETFAMMTQPNIAGFQGKDIEMPSNMTAMRFTDEVCNGSFCCQFDLNITYESQNNDPISYRAVAFSGSRPFGANLGPYDVEICGVYAYNKSSPADLKTVIFGPVLRKVTFTSVKITGNFRTSNSEILPDVLLLPGKTETFLPSSKDVTFTIGDKSELVWSPNKQIVSVGIHARLFKNAASLTQMSILMFLVSSIAVFLNNKKYY